MNKLGLFESGFFKKHGLCKIIGYILLLLLLLFLLSVIAGRYYFKVINRNYEYSGTVFSYYHNNLRSEGGGEELKFFFMNPKDRKDSVLIDMNKVGGDEYRVISLPLLAAGKFIFIIADKQKNNYLYTVKNGKKEIVQLKSSLPEEFFLKSLYEVDHRFFVACRNEIYEMDERTKEIRLIADDKEKYSTLLISKDNAGYVKKNGELQFLLKDKKNIKIKGRVCGYFEVGKRLLVYNRKQGGSFIVDMNTMAEEKYSLQPYTILSNNEDVTIMRMEARDGKYKVFYDDEFTFLDMVRTDWRRCFFPFMYNIKLNDVVNLPYDIEGKEQEYSAYFADDYNRETLEALRDTMYQTDHSNVK